MISYQGCNIGIVTNGPTVPVGGPQHTDSTLVPNEGVVRGGLFAPTPVRFAGGGDELHRWSGSRGSIRPGS